MGVFDCAVSLGVLGLNAYSPAGLGIWRISPSTIRRRIKVWTQSDFFPTLGISSYVFFFIFSYGSHVFSGPHPISWSMADQPFLNAMFAPLVVGHAPSVV